MTMRESLGQGYSITKAPFGGIGHVAGYRLFECCRTSCRGCQTRNLLPPLPPAAVRHRTRKDCVVCHLRLPGQMRLTAETLFFPLVTLLVFLSLWACHRGQQFSMREGFLLRKFKCRPSAEIPRWEWPCGGWSTRNPCELIKGNLSRYRRPRIL